MVKSHPTEMGATDSGGLARGDGLHCVVLVVMVVIAMLLAWPVAGLPYGDDTTYSYLALHLARTGQLSYNGWQTALLLFHSWWGALFIQLFGFSFNCLRLSAMPLSFGAVIFCYLWARQAGLRQQPAAFVTTVFGLSPLFLPIAASYMTDGPALFFEFFSIYSFSRAATESGSRSAYRGALLWLGAGAVASFIGGTSRQTVWLVPLLVLPYLAWVRRGRATFAMFTILTWISTLGGIFEVMTWFARQPYSIAQPSLLGEGMAVIRHPGLQVAAASRVVLMLLLVCLPVAIPLAIQTAIDIWRGIRLRKVALLCMLGSVLAAIFVHPSLASIPWLPSTLNWEGINGDAPLPGRPLVLGKPIRVVVAIVVYVTACVLASGLGNVRTVLKRAKNWFFIPSESEFSFAAMTLFSVVYFALVVLRNNDFDIFDRYLLPIMPWAAAALWTKFAPEQQQGAEKRRLARGVRLAWAALGLLSAYGIAATQDLWALARARERAAARLETSGIARTAIDGGFEYNAWTELLANGRLNSRWVTYPPGTFRAGLSTTPSVVPIYRLEYRPGPQTVPSEFGAVAFWSLLPPFHKQVSIDRVLKQGNGWAGELGWKRFDQEYCCERGR